MSSDSDLFKNFKNINEVLREFGKFVEENNGNCSTTVEKKRIRKT